MGDLTAHFSRSEFTCPCCGLYVPIDVCLLCGLERLRALSGKPLNIVSGVRCARYNKRVGGVSRSQHLYGRAADVARGRFRAADARAAGLIGIGVRDGWVIHVDVTPGRRTFTFRE